MVAKTLLALLAACNLSNPDGGDKHPPIEHGTDQHFCCSSVDADNYTGEGCILIGAESANTCANVLYCDKRWTKTDGNVKCE